MDVDLKYIGRLRTPIMIDILLIMPETLDDKIIDVTRSVINRRMFYNLLIIFISRVLTSTKGL